MKAANKVKKAVGEGGGVAAAAGDSAVGGKGKGRERGEVLRMGNVDKVRETNERCDLPLIYHNGCKVHPDIQPYTLGATERPTNMEQLEKQLLTPPVVATTCLSIEQ